MSACLRCCPLYPHQALFKHLSCVHKTALRYVVLRDGNAVKLFDDFIFLAVSTLRTLEISNVNFSISSSDRCLYTDADTSSPKEIIRIAAFCLPVSRFGSFLDMCIPPNPRTASCVAI